MWFMRGMHDPDGFYKILEIPPQSPIEVVKKAYGKMQMKYNPDVGKLSREIKNIKDPVLREKKQKELNEAIFKVNAAKEILFDENKKRQYDSGMSEADMRGESQMHGGAHFGDIFDVFSGFFDGHRGGGRKKTKQQTPPIIQKARLTFADVFCGKKAKYRVARKVFCKACDGRGGADVQTCSSCRGRGVITIEQRMGGLCIAREAPCDACDGSGERISGPQCSTCVGKALVVDPVEIQVEFPPGVKAGDKILFAGMGNCEKGLTPGDLVFVADVIEHPYLTRSGNDLVARMDVDLFEALLGMHLKFNTLDNRTLLIEIPPVKDLEKSYTLPNEGFSKKGQRTGRLVIVPIYKVRDFDKIGLMQAIKNTKQLGEGIRPNQNHNAIKAKIEKYEIEPVEEEEDDNQNDPFARFRSFFG